MCGIFAVLRAPGTRPPLSVETVDESLTRAVVASDDTDAVKGFTVAAQALGELNTWLKGIAGVRCLLDHPELSARIDHEIATIDTRVAAVEAELDGGRIEAADVETTNQALIALKDATWAIRKDRLRTAAAVLEMTASPSVAVSVVEGYLSIQLALSALDRLEVRGRDSAGVSVIVYAPGLTASLSDEVAQRHDPLFLNGAVDVSGDSLIFVYKAAAEIGALGDNVRRLRRAIIADDLLRKALGFAYVRTSVVAHTRWASVGTVSEPNAHPVDSQELRDAHNPCVIASLNGDVDNYAELKLENRLHVPDEITTDAKVIPVLVGRNIAAGQPLIEAFRHAVDCFEGSVAIAAAVADNPDSLLLAVRGSGQGCYIGLAEDAFLVASEPYGLVEECSTYLRLDGEGAAETSGKKGQIVALQRQGAGTLAGLRRISYGGEDLPVAETDLAQAEVTTRDIDRGGAEHFLLKEITESPASVRRTVRGKIVEDNHRLHVQLAPEAFPEVIKAALRDKKLKQVIAIGQGTAAIASRSLVAALETVAPAGIVVSARPATELSGFALRDDMSDTLIVAVSQSGTTTDTNRTVDLVRSRGAKVIAIVNRRQSDLTQRADGVLYTSDGRDVEMSVASTKAFYAQVTACTLLAIAIAEACGNEERAIVQEILQGFRRLPEAMAQVIERRGEIARAAQHFAPYRRSWAIVGNGVNYIAAQEVRIKLSELCYKSIAVDATEDKKHIDLSAEPMILVCAAGLTGSTSNDVAKEIAIYRAHKAAAIVIASEGTEFDAAAATIHVPVIHPAVDFVLSTMVGHLFGYEAALAIDAQARLMRSARAVVEDAIAAEYPDQDALFAAVRSAIALPATAIFSEVQSGALNGHLETRTAVQVVSLLRYAVGITPLDSLELETGRATSPAQMVDELLVALTAAVDELTRPVDAVKHQAKTVTVGISRTEETFADAWLVQEAVAAGAMRDRLGYRSMRTLAALQPAIEEVVGYTRYEVQGDADDVNPLLRVVDKGGVARQIVSRAETDPRLTGTKHRAADERMVTVGRGQRDGREFIIVPESKDQQVTGITLLHVVLKSTIDVATAKAVLMGYRGRYSAIVDAVMETESEFSDDRLADVPMIELLVEPVWVLSEHWRS